MKVYSINLGEVNANEVETKLKELAQELGYASLQKRHKELQEAINNADANNPCDAADERELQEVEFMMKQFQDEEGYVKDDIPF